MRAAAHRLDRPRVQLDAIVDKLRAREPLTEDERALVNARGEALMQLADEPPPGADARDDDLDDEEAADLCEALVLAEADRRDGKRGIPWRTLFPNHAG